MTRAACASVLLFLGACTSTSRQSAVPDASIAPDDAGISAQCQFHDVALRVDAGPAKGTTYAGQLHLAERSTGEIIGVLMGPIVEAGAQQRFSVSGTIDAGQVSLDLLLPDSRTLALTGTTDSALAACKGSMRGTFMGPGTGDSGTWSAIDPRPPPAAAAACVGEADPLVCGLYVN